MITRADLPIGTLVQVTERGPNARTYIGKIVGYDIWKTKYEIARRVRMWGEYTFLNGGAWAFPEWVQAVEE